MSKPTGVPVTIGSVLAWAPWSPQQLPVLMHGVHSYWHFCLGLLSYLRKTQTLS